MKKFSLSQWRLEREAWLALLAFGVNVFLVFNAFLPSLRDLNFWDEAVYINTGRLLVEGELPSFARNPLIGVLYGLAYLPFREAPLWMGQGAAIGRIILFALMWWSCYLAAREFGGLAMALTTAGFLLVFPVLPEALVNPSDALFAAMSGFAFWQTARFYHAQETRHLWGASFFIGLAALSRNDGLLLFPIFLLQALGISRRAAQGQAIPGEARRYAVNGAEEQAAVVMQETLPRGSLVMAGAPGGVWAARMEFQDANTYSALTSSEELYEALKEAGVTAIFVDPYLSNTNEHVWNLVEPGIGTWYESVYVGREGSIRVLLLEP